MGLRNGGSRASSAMASPFLDVPDDVEEMRANGNANGHIKGGGHGNGAPRMPKQHRATDSQQVRDAEEFELEGLISDVDEDADISSPVEGEKGKKFGKEGV